jgi:hypothetical protein
MLRAPYGGTKLNCWYPNNKLLSVLLEINTNFF